MKSSFSKVLLAFCVLVLASLACSAVNPAATTAPVVTMDSGGNQNPGGNDNTSVATQPPANDNSGGNTSGKKVFSDNFEGRNTHWGTGTDSDSSVEYVNGALQFMVITPKYFVFSQPNLTTYQNVHIEVTAQNSSTDSNAAFGIMCNQQVTDSAYYAYITPSGTYGIAKSAVAQDDTTFTSGSSDLITKNAQSYRIGLDCSNGTITLYVDGQKVDSAEDTSYTSGYLALFVWSDKVASGANVTYDDFVVTSLP